MERRARPKARQSAFAYLKDGHLASNSIASSGLPGKHTLSIKKDHGGAALIKARGTPPGRAAGGPLQARGEGTQ